jgi:hypothetical protein
MPMPAATALQPPVPALLNPEAAVGPRDWFEADTANLLYLNHMLATGRVPPRRVAPHQLTTAELIDFWADW